MKSKDEEGVGRERGKKEEGDGKRLFSHLYCSGKR
jgi:hypothetical protein